MNIALVHVVQPRIESDFSSRMQRFRRRPRLVLQFEIRMECSEMQWHVRAEMFHNPVGQLRIWRGSSFSVGIKRLVTSNQTFVSSFSHMSMSSTGCKCVSVIRP